MHTWSHLFESDMSAFQTSVLVSEAFELFNFSNSLLLHTMYGFKVFLEAKKKIYMCLVLRAIDFRPRH